MTLGAIATKARALTNTDLVSYPDANLLIDINIWYEKIVSMILESMDESDFDDARRTNYPIQTTPMVANQRDYAMPVSEKVLKIKRMDLAYDGVNFYRALPIDDGDPLYDMGANATTTDQNFIRTAPRYDVKYNSLWLYPMPLQADEDAVGLIRVEWERNIQPFVTADYTSVLTDSTVVPGFDDPFHAMLAHGAALEYSVSRQLPQLTQITSGLVDFEARLRQHYGKKELDRTLVLHSAYDDTYGR